MASFSSSPTSHMTVGRLLPKPATVARDALYLCAGLPAGVIAFSVLVTGLSLAAGLAVTLLGIPVLLATLYAARAMGDVERWRAGWALEAPIARSDRPWTGGIWSRFKAAFTDAGAWRDTVWGLILLPLGTFGFTVAVTAWTAALGLVTSPLWYWALPNDDDVDSRVLDWLNSTSVSASIGHVVLGLALIPVAAWLCRGLSSWTAAAARALLQH